MESLSDCEKPARGFRRDVPPRFAAGRRTEPFPLAVRRSAELVIRQRLESGRLSVQRLLEESSFTSITPPPNWPPNLWLNLNTTADLQALDPSAG